MSAPAPATSKKSLEVPARKHPIGGVLQQLMADMGSTRGFDPMPPDQYLYFLGKKESPLQRLLALVRAKTIRQGQRSPFCVDENGRELRLRQLQKLLDLDDGNFRRAWKEAVGRGLIRIGGRDEALHRAHPHHVYLCGSVDESVGYKYSLEESASLYRLAVLSPTDKKIVAGWPKERQKQFYARIESVVNTSKQILADAVAQARTRSDSILDEARTEFGLPVRRLPKRRTTQSSQSVQTRSVPTSESASVPTAASLLTQSKTELRPLPIAADAAMGTPRSTKTSEPQSRSTRTNGTNPRSRGTNPRAQREARMQAWLEEETRKQEEQDLTKARKQEEEWAKGKGAGA